MRPIVRKKMYKKGKFWVVAGIVTILGGSAILGQGRTGRSSNFNDLREN